ncbi:hypothetical protein G7L40_20080 [Paenibacillus polymyxa]|uniref:hypothetical protein n=1 Tax=Paenibacillus polymyxa TaxID=1406 RepID=UPI000374BC1B|nr:hypothetical protein [Paenibacillus polymyxa]MBE7896212.1 hypothetical protein [Paenibacillus polymyxa]MBG9765852.1 hypothetical protein [Paenibacillus polymyxa]MCC3256741.1 hypothetical protein [Paenibacillus polymyxa]QPK54771.1 hypothetical protein G7035_20120 [Paenibacillus polymyxa]QPK59862.1 hypothetical protein G7L40_20080 [Paenibacillus polymyxa]
MSKEILIEQNILLEVLSHMRKEGLIQNTYQFAGAKCIEVDGQRRIYINFEEWSYPFIMGREHSRTLPEQFYEHIK